MPALRRLSLKSAHDGFELGALRAEATAAKRGGVVVLQEIFGLTEHIGDVCTLFAEAGFDAIAPGMFERVEKDFHAGHDADGIKKGIGAVMRTPWPQVAGDVQAAIDALAKPCFVVGFCWGGAASWVAAARCHGLSAASCFYGRLIADLIEERPKAPVMLHYGARDAGIPHENVERVRAGAPLSPLYLYDAGHGFCRKQSPDYDAASCTLAMQRTLDWFARWSA